MKKMNKILTTLFLLALSAWGGANVYAQTPVSGTVKSAKGEPVVGAVVLLEGSTSVAGTTDLDGRYSLTIPAGVREPVLKASCIGYVEASQPQAGRTVVDFVLEEDAEELDEVVVVGYGYMRKSDLTGSVSSVRIDDNEASRSTSLSQLLQGHAAGVQVLSNSGAPDGGISIRIRGLSSFNGSSEPLYVVDGVIVNGSSSSETLLTQGMDNQGSDDSVNGLLGINPQDIASIEILKDASATAIYGSHGANGVVLITTKGANKERPTIRFNSGVDLSVVSKDTGMLSFDEYSDYIYDKFLLGVSTAATMLNQMYEDPSSRTGLKVYPVDWQKVALRKAVSQRYFLSISGRPKDLSYSFSLGYSDKEGIIKTTGVEQYTMRLNLDKKVGKRLSFGTKTNLSYVNSNLTQSTGGGRMTAATSLTRSLKSFRPFSNINYMEDYEDEQGNLQSSPLRWVDPNHFVNSRQEYRIIPNLYADVKIAPWLTFRSTIGGDYRNSELQKFKSARINTSAEGSNAASGTYEYFYWNWDNMLMFNKKIKGHSISGTLGSTLNKRFSSTQNIQGWNIDQYMSGMASINSAPNTSQTYTESQSQTESFFVRGIYSYKDRYVLTATYRVDGSSRFRGANRWASFPSFAFAWRINQEPWFDIPAVSMAKLRLGWGRVGNQNIGNMLTMSNFSNTTIPTHDPGNEAEATVVLYPNNLANPALKWETTEQLNAGLDLNLWKGRFSLSADVYRKLTYDLLQQKIIPSSSGFSNIYVNEGDIENRGLEISMDLVPVRTPDFEWTVNGNISFNRNKIIKISETADTKSVFITPDQARKVVYFYGNSLGSSNFLTYPGNIFMEGYPMGLFYGWQVKGIVQEGENGAPLTNGAEARKPGFISYADLNGNGYIDVEDRTILGNPNPDFIFGFGTTLNYKGLSLSVNFNGSYGNDIINMDAASETDTYSSNRNVYRDAYYKAWTPEHPDTTYPGLGCMSSDDTKMVSSWYIEDGSYLRLANVSLGYDLPIKKTSKFFKGVGFSASASNLHVWTRYSGWDPDVNSFGSDIRRMGCDSGAYPNARTFSFDVRFTF